ncbi:MAG: hypothetical protein ABEH88_10100, partial [Halobacteriales archaeon]
MKSTNLNQFDITAMFDSVAENVLEQLDQTGRVTFQGEITVRLQPHVVRILSDRDIDNRTPRTGGPSNYQYFCPTVYRRGP